MAGKSSIEWTTDTWNPVTGCTKVSSGCKNCYAERMAKRLQGMGLRQYRNGFAVTLAPDVLERPYQWKRPRLIFVNSMSDLFHEDVPTDYVSHVFRVMKETPQHTYQILTKRADRLVHLGARLDWPLNVWMGVSVEDRRSASRIDALRACGARTRFVSIEPLIAPVGRIDLSNIDWVIVGGESGPRARPIKREWAVDVRDQCQRHGVAFFFKQWGKPQFNANPDDPTIAEAHPLHAKGGCELDGRVHRDLPARHLTGRCS